MAASSNNRPWWRKALDIMLWGLTVIAALGTIAGAYGGDYSPAECRWLCLFVLSFPGWIALLLLMTVLDALWCRKALLAVVPTLVVCATAIYNFSPLNITGPSEKTYADCPKIKVLSYNVAGFHDNDSTYTYPGDFNRTIDNIIQADADIVCIQEAYGIYSTPRNPVSREQLDTIHAMYPYIYTSCESLLLLSKYPATPLATGHVDGKTNDIAVYRLEVEGVPVTLFNVHLESYNLRRNDKDLYQGITNLDKGGNSIRATLSGVKSQLIGKIIHSAEARAVNADRLCSYIESLGGPNIIVTGDFNDVPGCYTLRQLAGHDLKEVYPQVGFGPMITFNADRFYFRIDHTLYRGALAPLSMTRGRVPSSDHYPLLTTFALTAPEK